MFADVRRLHRMRQKLDMMSCAVPNSSDEHLDFWIPYNDANLPDTSGGAQCTKAGKGGSTFKPKFMRCGFCSVVRHDLLLPAMMSSRERNAVNR
jgi:hypothetical protein